MDSENRKTLGDTRRPGKHWTESSGNRSGRVFGGLLIIVVGLIFLARQLGAEIPHWLVSWETILIAIGLFVGFRHSFRGPVWIIMTMIGAVFLIDEINPDWDFNNVLWPVVVIAIGLIILFRPARRRGDPFAGRDIAPASEAPGAAEDLVDSVIVFGGVKKRIISKTFRGGELTTIFGGSELDLTQADVNHRIVLDLTQIFGGTKLIVPPHWQIESEELVCIFGGLDDKRAIHADITPDVKKLLVLRGTCLFGGIDIKSF